MKRFKNLLSVIIATVAIVIVVYGVHFWYLYTNRYVATGALDQERIATIAAKKGPSIHYVATGALDAEKIATIAAKKGASICGKIETPPFPFFIDGFDITKDGIVMLCYFRTAQLLRDESICDSITHVSSRATGYRASCIGRIALVKNDHALCEGIKNQLDKGSCYTRFTVKGVDAAVCENIDESVRGTELSGKDLCYLGSAQFNPNLVICENNIKTEHYKNLCYDVVARGIGDRSICEKIQGLYQDFRRNACIKHVEKFYRPR